MDDARLTIPEDLLYLLTTDHIGGATYRRREHPREVFVIEPDYVRTGQGGWLPKRRGPLGA